MCIAEYLSKWRKTIFMDKLFFNKTDGTCNKNEHFSNLHNLHSLYMVNYHRSWNITHEWNTVININANTNSIQRFAGQLQICNEYSMFVDLHLHFFCVKWEMLILRTSWVRNALKWTILLQMPSTKIVGLITYDFNCLKERQCGNVNHGKTLLNCVFVCLASAQQVHVMAVSFCSSGRALALVLSALKPTTIR